MRLRAMNRKDSKVNNMYLNFPTIKASGLREKNVNASAAARLDKNIHWFCYENNGANNNIGICIEVICLSRTQKNTVSIKS